MKHVMSRNGELTVGFLAFVLGAYLIYCAYDGRGKKTPWPLGAITPF